MRYFTLLKANISRRKSSFIGVTILIFIVTVSLTAVLTVWSNSKKYEDKQMDRLGFGDLTSWVSKVYDMDKLKQQICDVKDIEKVEEQDLLFADYEINNKKAGTTGIFLNYCPNKYDYYFFNNELTDLSDKKAVIKPGEIYVSPAFCSMYNAKLGDKVKLTNTGDKNYEYTIKGFFEDPFMGGSMMGLKGFLLCDSDMERLVASQLTLGDDPTIVSGAMLHIFINSDSKETVSKLQSKINSQTDLSKYALFTYQKSSIKGFMLILQDIFSGFLIVFVLVLLVVTILVIGHSISSSIEQDYVNMGILKAVGFTVDKLRLIQIVQYFIAIVFGILIGLPVSILVINIINRITVISTGLMIPDKPPILLCLASFTLIISVLMIFIYIKTIKIGRIKPIKAIRGGEEDIFFKSRLTLPIYKRCMNVWLALRQLVSCKKQYISVGIITSLLVFFLMLISRINAWFGPDGSGMMNAFNAVNYDLGVYSDKISESEIEDVIKKYSDISDKFQYRNFNVTLEGLDYTVNVVSDYNKYSVLKGRVCKFDNEILVTEFVANDLHVGIGDLITVNNSGKEAEYIISGINQCSNDMGANCSMSKEGYDRIANMDYNMSNCYVFSDSSKTKNIVNELKKKYNDNVNISDGGWSGIDSISDTMNYLEILMYVIVLVFIFVVIWLNGSKILYKEKRDMGIYKSLGFDSLKLRITFAIRFAIVSGIGSLIGIVLSALITDKMATVILRTCGVSTFSSHLGVEATVFPCEMVIILFMIFAYFISGRIKYVDPKILIIE